MDAASGQRQSLRWRVAMGILQKRLPRPKCAHEMCTQLIVGHSLRDAMRPVPGPRRIDRPRPVPLLSLGFGIWPPTRSAKPRQKNKARSTELQSQLQKRGLRIPTYLLYQFLQASSVNVEDKLQHATQMSVSAVSKGIQPVHLALVSVADFVLTLYFLYFCWPEITKVQDCSFAEA